MIFYHFFFLFLCIFIHKYLLKNILLNWWTEVLMKNLRAAVWSSIREMSIWLKLIMVSWFRSHLFFVHFNEHYFFVVEFPWTTTLNVQMKHIKQVNYYYNNITFFRHNLATLTFHIPYHSGNFIGKHIASKYTWEIKLFPELLILNK